MAEARLLLPDFLLIVAGWLLCRFTPLNRPLWSAVERLVYVVLFPALLFTSIVRNPVRLDAALPVVGAALGVTLLGIALALSLRLLPRVDAALHASGAQVAFRFNSYVALAFAERLAGPPGLAWMALIVSVCVPLCNVAAVWPLARQGGRHFLGELGRNPLILSTFSGLACNVAGVQLPEVATTTLSRMGAAALPLGLMAVGAGLQMGALREAPRLAAGLLAIRHLALPAAGLLASLAAGLQGAPQAVVVAYAAMPTASSAYVLAVRMGGNGPFVAGLVTLSTLLGMAVLPLSLTALRALRPLGG
ncbi:MAG: AEC family transporter [Rubrivivax sp.]